MLSKKLEAALNKQINEEYYSSYIYLAMAAYLEDANLDGCAHWMRMQAQEEHLHAMKIFDYMIERGARVELFAVNAPPKEWDGAVAAFEAALEHEQYMTGNINALAELAITEKDYATNNLMQWYVTEQVEEESQVEDILKKLAMMGADGPGLFLMDRELMNRPVPSIVAGGGA
ncbi:MAG: ferritin [bacterium]|nr:ferritin [bacterium]